MTSRKETMTLDIQGYVDNPREVREELREGLKLFSGVESVSILDRTSELNLPEGTLMASYILNGNRLNGGEITSFFTDQGYTIVNGGVGS